MKIRGLGFLADELGHDGKPIRATTGVTMNDIDCDTNPKQSGLRKLVVKQFSIPSPLEITPYVQKGLVSQRIGRSGSATLAIYNYTDLCDELKAWDRVTCACRGLILQEETGQVVALPFPKFFNVDEMPETEWGRLPWDRRCAIVEKYDGALGIVYYDPGVGRWDIATRGTFGSAEAQYAREHLLPKLNLNRLEEDSTYLMEIVLCNRNLGLVRYDWEGLVLIGRRNNFTGEMEWPEDLPVRATQIGAVPPRVYADSSDIQGFLRAFRTNNAMSEGVVLTFEAGPMVKFKTDKYRQLLGTIRWFSQANAIALVAQGREEELLASLPPERATPLRQFIRRCVGLREELRQAILSSFEILKAIPDRKAFATAVQTQTPAAWRRFMFALRDGKDISRLLEAELAARFDVELGGL